MEPVKGGSLSHVDKHTEIAGLFREAAPNMSPSAWALRYAASLDGVLTVLSGMSSLKQMRENHNILMERFDPLSADEYKMLSKVAEILIGKAPVGCTGCRYCVDNGYLYLTVKTLDSSAQYEPYERTRAFYKSMGFLPLEVFTTFWNEENPCLFMAKWLGERH